MSILPFDPPLFLTARTKTGFVDIPDCAKDDDAYSRGWDTTAGGNDSAYFDGGGSPSAGPPVLQRRQTMSGNIVVVTQPEGGPLAFWLQRKIGKISHGIIRLGYKLRPNTKEAFKDSSDCWELETDEMGRQTLVTISIMHSSVIDQPRSSVLTATSTPLDELSALQMICRHNPTETAHVVGTNILATCSQSVYAVLPYHRDGTLLQFCQSVGLLEEPLARFLFRQILQGLSTLQETGLCHRNLSMDNIGMEGDHLDICELGWALRFNTTTAHLDQDHPFPPPGGSDPRFIAPEYFFGTGTTGGDVAWNGFRADLWAAGLMLYIMVVGTESLFTAPIAEDKTFAKLCMKGDVRGHLKKYGKVVGRDFSALSEELVDLLRSMLRFDPTRRLSLEGVLQHLWVVKDDVVTPSEWMEMNRPDGCVDKLSPAPAGEPIPVSAEASPATEATTTS